jgi:hypothetical protein
MGGYVFGAGIPTWNDVPMIGAFQKDFSGSTYFVDNNSGSDGNTGRSWSKPFKTLAKAIAISNIDIARGADRWARRNTIFYCADEETANLVAYPNKCDVIGCGSDGQHTMAGILGNHAPVNVYTACRFFNVRFVTVAAGIICSHISTSSATEYIGCKFDADGAAHATEGVLGTAHTYLKVVGCRFQGPFSTGYVGIGAGNASGLEIKGNEMFDSAAEGINIAGGATSTPGGIIRDNFVQTTTVGIHDASGLFFVVGNTIVTAAAHAYGTSIIVNLAKAARNMITGSDETSQHPVDMNSAT